MRSYVSVIVLGLAISGCGGSKGLTSAQVPTQKECSGYQVTTTLKGDMLKLNVAKGAPVVELVYKQLPNSTSYELTTITPPDKLSDPGPPATATVTGTKVCFGWSADDSSTDPCLAAVQKAEWCVTTQ